MTQTPNGTPTGYRYFSFLLKSQTGPGAHPASYSLGVEGSSLEVKLQGYEDDQSPPNSVEVKNEWSYTATPPNLFMAWTWATLPFLELYPLWQCFSTAGPRPSTGPWHQLYRAARDSPGIDN